MRRKRRVRLGAAAVLILVVAFVVGAWVVVPLGAGKALEQWAAVEAGRSASVRQVSVNPFTLTVTLHDLALEAPAGSAAVDRVALDFGFASLVGSVAVLDGLTVEGPRVVLAAPDSADGESEVADLIPGRSFAIARAEVSGGRVEWVGEGGAPLVFDGLTARALDLDNRSERPARFEIDVRSVAGGVLRLDGEVVLGARTASGRAHLENVDAAQIATQFFASPSVAGTSSGTAEFEWRGAEGELELRNAALHVIGAEMEWPSGAALTAASAEAAGDADLGSVPWRVSGTFDLLRAELRDSAGAVWLETERFGARGVEAEIEAGAASAAGTPSALELGSRASVDALSLSGPRATIVLNAADDGPRNRALDAALGMLSRGGGAVGGDGTQRLAAAVAAGRIELEGGVLEIVDAGLGDVRPALRADGVEGVIMRDDALADDAASTRARDGASGSARARGEESASAPNDAGAPGQRESPGIVAELAARVGNAGSAALRVRAALGGERRTRDVALDLSGVPAAAFAAHARRLTGYGLDGGTIDATIEYRIGADGVAGTARIAAQGTDLEPSPETEDDAQVRLALALLEDAEGRVETGFGFHAPRGATGIGSLLADAVLARLDAVAAAPFVALGDAVGIDGEVLAAVSFPAGQAAPSEPATIDALAEAMHARPGVGLRVQGVASRALDRDALAAQQIELHVTLATAGPTLVARPQPVDFASPRHRDVLDEFAGERLSDERRETIASYFTRTPEGRIVEDERNAYYRAVFDALVENETIPESGIERLGRYRARSIADGLTARGIAETRIEIAPIVVMRPVANAPDEAADRIDVPLEVVIAPSGAAAPRPATASADDGALDAAPPARSD